MFRIDEDPKFWTQVTVRLPESEPQTFRARFRALSISEFNSFDLADPAEVERFLEVSVTDLGDIEDDDGRPLGFSELLLARLTDKPHIRAALVRAYAEGIAGAARGN